MLTFSLIVQLILLFAPPIGVAIWLNRSLRLSWFLFMGGALAYAVAWMIAALTPAQLNLLVSSMLQIGALYVVYRFLLSDVSTEREAIMVGAGQGGIELMLLGIFAALSVLQIAQLRNAPDDTLISIAAEADDVPEQEIQPSRIDELRASIDVFAETPWYGPVVHPVQSFVQVLPLRNASDEKLITLIADVNDLAEEDVEPERVTALRAFIDSFWESPWYAPLVQPLQSLPYLPIQMVLAVMVLGGVVNNSWRTLIGAMALYLLARVLPLYGQMLGGLFAWVGLSLLFGGAAVWYLHRLWPTVQRPAETAAPPTKSGKQKR